MYQMIKCTMLISKLRFIVSNELFDFYYLGTNVPMNYPTPIPIKMWILLLTHPKKCLVVAVATAGLVVVLSSCNYHHQQQHCHKCEPRPA